MTHTKRMLIGFIMLLCMVIFAFSASVIIDLVVEATSINPVVLFYGFFGIVCVVVICYALGMIAEEVLGRRARDEERTWPKSPPG